jgi:hypothetical protein
VLGEKGVAKLMAQSLKEEQAADRSRTRKGSRRSKRARR